jgi:hypothetical protein
MKKTIALLVIIFIAFSGQAQEIGDEQQQAKSNIQEYTPSKLLKKGQWDIKSFNSIYTQTERTDAGSKSVKIPRETFLTNTTEVYTGVSKNSRINIGLIFQFRANTFGGAGALDVLKLKDNGNSRSGLTTIAPSIRVQPFGGVPNFSFTSSIYFPVFKDKGLPGQFNDPPYLDKRSIFWETKFFFDKTFGSGDWQLFTEVDLGFNFGEKRDEADFNTSNVSERFANNSMFVPVSVFLSYFPTAKATVFVNAKQTFLIDLGNDFEQNATSLGVGVKYQLIKILNVEASFDKFVRGHNFQGLGQTFSAGFRLLF